MSILKEGLKEYNQQEANEDRWEIWRSHRETVKELQDKNIFSKSGKIDTAIVLGAGNCDDIDLNYLCSKLSKLTLVDLNLESMKDGVRKQNLPAEYYDKLEFIGNIDFTGLEDTNFYEELDKLLAKSSKPKKILKLITDSLKSIDDRAILSKLSEDSYSLVMSGAVHSQLTVVAIDLLNKYRANYKDREIKKINKDLIYMDDTIALKYNDLIMSLAKSDTLVFSWFDLNEFSEKLGNYNKLGEVEKYCREENSEKIIELVTKNKLAGFYGYLDLNKRALESELKVKPWVNFWMWPYSPSKSYLVLSITIDLNKE